MKKPIVSLIDWVARNKIYYAERNNLYLIYTMGKVGSSTLYETKKSGII